MYFSEVSFCYLRKLYKPKSYIWLTLRFSTIYEKKNSWEKSSFALNFSLSSVCSISHWVVFEVNQDKISSVEHYIIIMMVWMIWQMNGKINKETKTQNNKRLFL